MRLTKDETKTLMEALGEAYRSGEYAASIYPPLEDHHITQRRFAKSEGIVASTAGPFLDKLVEAGELVQERRHNTETGRWVYVYLPPDQ